MIKILFSCGLGLIGVPALASDATTALAVSTFQNAIKAQAVETSPVPTATPTPTPTPVITTNPNTLKLAPTPVVTPTPTPTPPATTSNTTGTTNSGTSNQASINPSANSGQQSQSAGSMINMAVGGAMLAAAMATQPPNVPMMIMGLAGLAQGAMDGGAAGDSANTAAASTVGATGDNGATPQSVVTTPSNPAMNGGKAAFKSPAAKAAVAALQEAGYSVNPTTGTVTNPDGSTTPASAFSSASGMSAAGMDPNQIVAAQKVVSALNAEASKARISGLALSAEGGGGGGAGGAGASLAGLELNLKNPFAISNAMKKQMVAGKTVLFDGDPIGVRGQDIFDMVHTAYDKKRNTNHFIETDSVAQIRTPANSAPVTKATARGKPTR